MSVNIRYPNIKSGSEREQISQIKSYLHQLVDHLNYALPTIGTGDGASQSSTHVQGEEISYYDLRSLIVQELQEVQTLFDQLSAQILAEYLRKEDAQADYLQKKDAAETYIGKDKLSFELDADGNLYYVLEE